MNQSSFFDRLWRMLVDAADRAGRLGFIGTVEHLLHADEHKIDLACAVVLVDIACIDNDFSPRENYFVKQAMIEHLGITYEHAVDLVQKAKTLVQSEKDVESFGQYLRDHLSEPRRREIAEVIERLILEDSVDHPFEDDLRDRYFKILGLPNDQSVPTHS